MSLLIYNLDADRQHVEIFTDTLAADDQARPGLYVSKCMVLPHLQLAIANTGYAIGINDWLPFILTRMRCRDFDDLTQHTPEQLRRIWSEFLAAHPEIVDSPRWQQADDFPDGLTTTVYHFGLSVELGGIAALAFRSTNDFETEVIPPGLFAVKPPPADGVVPPRDLAGLIDLAERIRSEENARPAVGRVVIGGELYSTLIVAGSPAGGGLQIATRRVHRFHDFDDDWEAMNDPRFAAIGRPQMGPDGPAQ